MKNSSIFLALILSCSFMGVFAMDQDQSKNINIRTITGQKRSSAVIDEDDDAIAPNATEPARLPGVAALLANINDRNQNQVSHNTQPPILFGFAALLRAINSDQAALPAPAVPQPIAVIPQEHAINQVNQHQQANNNNDNNNDDDDDDDDDGDEAANGVLSTQSAVHANKKRFPCTFEGCDYKAAQQSHLTDHMNTHSGHKPFLCSVGGCPFRTARKDYLKHHMRKRHPNHHANNNNNNNNNDDDDDGDDDDGDEAANGVPSTQSAVHANNKQLACTVAGCSKQFSWPSELKRHIKTHFGKKLFPCTFEGCNFRSAQQSYLKYHMKTRHPNQAIANLVEPQDQNITSPDDDDDMDQDRSKNANVIGITQERLTGSKRTFDELAVVPAATNAFNAAASNLYHHANNNNNNNNNNNDDDGNDDDDDGDEAANGVPSTQSAVHANKKRFPCTVVGCSKQFRWPSELKRHMNTHSDEKLFACSVEGCDFKCGDKSNLAKHIRRHTEGKRFPCSFEGCDYKAEQQSHLTDHMNTHSGHKPFLCSVGGCTFRTARKDYLKHHMRKRHPNHHANNNNNNNNNDDDDEAANGVPSTQSAVHANNKHSPALSLAAVNNFAGKANSKDI